MSVENYYIARDPYLKKETRGQMRLSISGADQGSMFEHFMMSVFRETFNTRPLSEWPHRPPISEMCEALVGKVEIVGSTRRLMSMEEFMDAHATNQLATTRLWSRSSSPRPYRQGHTRCSSSGSTVVQWSLFSSDEVASTVVQLLCEALERGTRHSFSTRDREPCQRFPHVLPRQRVHQHGRRILHQIDFQVGSRS